MQWHFALDFDGTICPVDTTDFILDRFAAPEWRKIEEEWESGILDTRTCLRRQLELIRASPDALDTALRGLPLDADFVAFVRDATAQGASVSIVSDGFDHFLRTLLVANGIDLPFTANQIVHAGSNTWAASFAPRNAGCPNGTCKCAVAMTPDTHVVLVGDGRSDFCLARQADFVLAKGRLAEFCRANAIPHLPIAGFRDARAYLARIAPATTMPSPFLAPLEPETLDA